MNKQNRSRVKYREKLIVAIRKGPGDTCEISEGDKEI